MNPADINAPLQLLVPLAGILIGGRLAAHISQRMGLPPVLGELILGLLIGPSLLGWIAPSPVINFMSEIGVILLMFMAGVETDVKAMRKVGGASLLAAIGGCVMPLVLGWIAGKAAGMTWQMSLFLGTVLTATSVSITAQTLREMGHLRSLEGSTILGAAVIDDVIGVLIFAVVMGIIGEGANPLVTLLKMALFFPIAWIAGNLIIPLILKVGKAPGNARSQLGCIRGAAPAVCLGSRSTGQRGDDHRGLHFGSAGSAAHNWRTPRACGHVGPGLRDLYSSLFH